MLLKQSRLVWLASDCTGDTGGGFGMFTPEQISVDLPPKKESSVKVRLEQRKGGNMTRRGYKPEHK